MGCPGKPQIEFVTYPSACVELRNEQGCEPYHTMFVQVRDGETCSEMVKRLFKSHYFIKDLKNIKLMRFEDVIGGPRRIPIIKSDPCQGLVSINDSDKFKIVDDQVKLTSGKDEVNIEKTLVYIVQA